LQFAWKTSIPERESEFETAQRSAGRSDSRAACLSGTQSHPVIRSAPEPSSVPRVGPLGTRVEGGCILVLSLLYLLFRRVLAVVSLRLRSREFKELKIVVLRHELAVLRRQISRPRLDERDRVFLAAAGQLLGRKSLSFLVRPDTLLGWHRQLVRKRWTYARRRPGRPAVSEEIRALVLRLARENPRWGYERIVGELAGVGVRVSATTVAKMLRQAGVPPAGARAELSWRDFVRAHADSIIACDFFAVETLWLGRLYVLFFLELGSRRVHFAGCTANPDGRWTAQQAPAACLVTPRADDASPLPCPRPRQ
jgi:putative transposase